MCKVIWYQGRRESFAKEEICECSSEGVKSLQDAQDEEGFRQRKPIQWMLPLRVYDFLVEPTLTHRHPKFVRSSPEASLSVSCIQGIRTNV